LQTASTDWYYCYVARNLCGWRTIHEKSACNRNGYRRCGILHTLASPSRILLSPSCDHGYLPVGVHGIRIVPRSVGLVDTVAVNTFTIQMAAANFAQAVVRMGDFLRGHRDSTAFYCCLWW